MLSPSYYRKPTSSQRQHEHRILRLLSGLENAERRSQDDTTFPSFSHAIRLNCDRLKCKQFVDINDNNRNITFRYKVSSKILAMEKTTQQQNRSCVSLCTYLAIIDEITTFAFMILQNTRRPGISACLQGKWGSAASSVKVGDSIDIVASISKIDNERGVAYINAAIFILDDGGNDATTSSGGSNYTRDNDKVVCYATHVKHINAGRKLPVRGGCRFLSRWACSAVSGTSETKPQTYDLQSIFAALEPSIVENGTIATFVATSHHSHYYQCGGGTQDKKHKNEHNCLHNGCQSMLMELVGMQEAKNVLLTNYVELESVNIAFQRSALSPIVDLSTQIVSYNETSVSMRVIIRRGNEQERSGLQTIISEGLFKWKMSQQPHHGHKRQLQQEELYRCVSNGTLESAHGASLTISSDESDFSSTAYPASVIQQTHQKYVEKDRLRQKWPEDEDRSKRKNINSSTSDLSATNMGTQHCAANKEMTIKRTELPHLCDNGNNAKPGRVIRNSKGPSRRQWVDDGVGSSPPPPTVHKTHCSRHGTSNSKNQRQKQFPVLHEQAVPIHFQYSIGTIDSIPKETPLQAKTSADACSEVQTIEISVIAGQWSSLSSKDHPTNIPGDYDSRRSSCLLSSTVGMYELDTRT